MDPLVVEYQRPVPTLHSPLHDSKVGLVVIVGRESAGNRTGLG